MNDARAWTSPTLDELRSLLPPTQAARDELAKQLGVSPRTMRYWWVGKRKPSYAQWRLLVDSVPQTGDLNRAGPMDERRVPRGDDGQA